MLQSCTGFPALPAMARTGLGGDTNPIAVCQRSTLDNTGGTSIASCWRASSAAAGGSVDQGPVLESDGAARGTNRYERSDKRDAPNDSSSAHFDVRH